MLPVKFITSLWVYRFFVDDFLLPPPKMAFMEGKHYAGNLALAWCFRKTFLQIHVVFRTSLIFFRYGPFLSSYGYFWVKVAQNAFLEGTHIKRNLVFAWYCLLTDSLRDKIIFSDAVIFWRVMSWVYLCVCFRKYSSKCSPGGLTQWRKPDIGLVFQENFSIDSPQNKFNCFYIRLFLLSYGCFE